MKRSTKHEKKMRWLADNEAWLESEHPGMWVAIGDDGFAGAGETFGQALDAAEAAGVTDSVIVPVRAKALQGVYLIRQCR
jgi:sirohydrochlorin ferrochelatase